MTAKVFDASVCALGEGLLWHPLRKQLFWFDILDKCLITIDAEGEQLRWYFREFASAAGWVDHDTLLVATATDLLRLNIVNDSRDVITPLEAENMTTRSNDGRADPFGGFWIGTMGLNAEPEAGAIYRYYRGELRKLFPRVTIPNAICFTPDGSHAFYADTAKHKVWRVDLNSDGWPIGTPRVFLDLQSKGLHPDGAVIGADGLFWNAQWGAGRIAAYSMDGEMVQELPLPAPHVTCPAFGGAELQTLYCTSATQGLNASDLKERPLSGQTFDLGKCGQGQAEHQVIL